MTKYNDLFPDDHWAAMSTAWDDLAPMLDESEDARRKAIRLMKETAELGGPGPHFRLLNGFINLARQRSGDLRIEKDPKEPISPYEQWRREVIERVLAGHDADDSGLRMFELETTLDWLNSSTHDHELAVALGHILRLMKQGTEYWQALELYGIRGHPYFKEYWPVRRYYGEARRAREELGLPVDE